MHTDVGVWRLRIMWEILSLFLLLLAQCQSIGDTNVMGWVLIPVCNVNFELNFFFFFLPSWLSKEQLSSFHNQAKILLSVLFHLSVVLVIGSYTIGLETLYLAKQQEMISRDYAFILFELDQLAVKRNNRLKFFWFHQRIPIKRLVFNRL